MFCSSCGAQLNAGTAFCASCGSPAAPDASMAPTLPIPSPLTAPAPSPSFAAPPFPVAVQRVVSAPITSDVVKEPLTSQARNRLVVLLIGGALLAIGALLPWETASGPFVSASQKGPSLLLICGLVIGLLAVLLFSSTVKRNAVIVTLVLAAVSLVDAFANASTASDDVDTAKDLGVNASLGAGVGIAIVGALMAGIASVLFLRATRVGAQLQNPSA